MKKIVAAVLCLMLLTGGFALADEVKTSFQAETVLMPALYLQMSVPADMRASRMNEPSFQVEYDTGMRYDGSNKDLSILVWSYNNLDGITSEEFAQRFTASGLDYQTEPTELNGWPAYRLWRDPEPTSVGYILTDETELVGVDVAYTLFFTTSSDAGVALRDEILSTIRSVAF